MTAIHLLFENPAWSAPLIAELERRGLPVATWNMAQGGVDISSAPPEGVFFSRMSASAHTRGHLHATDYAGAVLAWLENNGRTVLNGSSVLRLELSKAAQYAALARHGIRVPDTVVSHGRDAAIASAARFTGPFIAKHNRGGKGLGVHLIDDVAALARLLDDPDTEQPVDGIWLLQQYVQAPEPVVTRVEFVDGKLLYAVRVDTSGGFELCPAEVCVTPQAAEAETFQIIPGFEHPLVERYERFLAANRIAVAGIEFIVDGHGQAFTYDVNTNTNYNPLAETKAGVSGIAAVADMLARALGRAPESTAAG